MGSLHATGCLIQQGYSFLHQLLRQERSFCVRVTWTCLSWRLRTHLHLFPGLPLPYIPIHPCGSIQISQDVVSFNMVMPPNSFYIWAPTSLISSTHGNRLGAILGHLVVPLLVCCNALSQWFPSWWGVTHQSETYYPFPLKGCESRVRSSLEIQKACMAHDRFFKTLCL